MEYTDTATHCITIKNTKDEYAFLYMHTPRRVAVP